MPNRKLNPRQIRNLMVISLLSFILALPLLSQPLGLSAAWAVSPATSAGEAPETGKAATTTMAASILMPVEEFEVGDELYNRSLNENKTLPTEPAAGSAENQYDPAIFGDYNDDFEDETGAPVVEPTDPPYVDVDYVLYIAANTLNLRAEPSTDSEIVAKLKFGDKVRCQGENAEWMKVSYEDQVGYLKTEYTSRTMVFEWVKETVYVDANKLNLRAEPSTAAEILVVMRSDDKLTRIGIGDGWSQVKTSSGKTGYVASDYLTKQAPVVVSKNTKGTTKGTGGSSAPATSDGPTYSGDAGKIVDLAYSALGVKYVYAHASLSSGFDCSGLTSWAYKQIGISIPRSTGGYYNAGKGVSYADIQPGDVLCMDTRSRDGKTSITHVGIYVGNGMMIHASSRLGKVVLQSVSQYFSWGVKLITVRRFIG